PDARYTSAGEMAEDLKRFVEDRPIQARRASTMERLWRWTRRNPVVAGLTAATLVLLLVAASASTLAAFSFHGLAEQEKAEHERIAEDLQRLHEANSLLESGFRHAVRKDWSRALDDYAAAIEIRPDHSQVWSDRAMMYLRLGLAEEAAADFDRLFELRPP